MPDDDPTVITRRDDRVGRILLNRPRVLNTLTLDMVRTMTRALTEFSEDPHVHAVVVEGAGSVVAGERERCMDAGANDYVPKPVNTSELISAIGPWLPADVEATS